jgi:hypothetical protein
MDFGYDEIVDSNFCHARKQVLHDLEVLAPDKDSYYGYYCPACMQKYLTPHALYYILLEAGRALAYCPTCNKEFELHRANVDAGRKEYERYNVSGQYFREFYRSTDSHGR